MAKKTKTKKKALKREEIGKKLNLKQSLFCQYFVKNSALRGNATLCYAEAYGYDLESMSTEDKKVKEWNEEKEEYEEKIIFRSSERAIAEDTCSSNGQRLLRNDKIDAEIIRLYNELLRDDVVDSRLAELIIQKEEPATAIAGIREYNKLRKRVTDLIEIKRPLEDMSDEELAEVQKEARKLLTKQ